MEGLRDICRGLCRPSYLPRDALGGGLFFPINPSWLPGVFPIPPQLLPPS